MKTTGRALGVFGLFVLLAALHTWPLADAPSRRLHQERDVLSAQWSLTELAHQLISDPAHLMDGNIFYPYRDTIASLDHQLTNAVMSVPLVAAGANGAQVYNLVFLASFVLSGLFAYLLVRRLTGSTAAGLVAGCAYAFSSYRALHLTQGHLLVTQWLPLALLALHGYLERPTASRWVGVAAATLLVALSSWHMAVIGAVAIAVVAVWTLTADRRGLGRRAVGLALVAILCGVALLPLARSYARMGEQWPPRTGEGRETVDTLAALSASVAGVVTPPANSRAPYAALTTGVERSQPGIFPGLAVLVLGLPALLLLGRRETRTGPKPARLLRWWLLGATGLVVVTMVAALLGQAGEVVVSALRPLAPFVLFGLALAAVGLRAARHADAGPDVRLIRTYLALAVAGALLALGPRVFVGSVDVGSGLWRLDLLPVRLIMRAPERLSLLLALGTSVLAGFGVARLLRGRTAMIRAIATAALLVVVNADLAFRTPQLMDVPGPNAVDRWLADSPDEGAVIDYPLLWTNRWAVYKSQDYNRRIVNGTGYLLPPEYLAMEGVPDLSPEQLDIVWEFFHPRFVVIRSDVYDAAERARALSAVAAQPDALALRARFGSDYVYELFDRGRGAELLRRWPAGALWDKRELVLEGLVTEGRSDTTGRLDVSLNGRTLLETPPGVAERTGQYSVAFTADDLIPGTNTFEIAASYDFDETAERHAIGSTGADLPADVLVTSDRERATVQVNGRVLRFGRGYFLVVIDPASGRVMRTGLFDTSGTIGAADALVAFVRQIPAGAPVIVATEFDASRELTTGAVEALGTLGIAIDLRDQFQTMHAAIGVKGAPPGAALESTDRQTARVALGTPDSRAVHLDSLEVR